VSGGYGISKDGSMTGIATYGSAPYDAIKTLEPAPPVVLVKADPPKAVLEEESNAPYVFRAILGLFAMVYFGILILSKGGSEIGCGGHLILGSTAVWSILCAVGVISISTFLCPYIALVILVVAIGALLGSIPFIS
jgi:hypothetical protein